MIPYSQKEFSELKKQINSINGLKFYFSSIIRNFLKYEIYPFKIKIKFNFEIILYQFSSSEIFIVFSKFIIIFKIFRNA